MGNVAMTKLDQKWQAESDLKTLIESKAIKKDKARFKRAMKEAREQQSNLNKVIGEKA